MELRDGALSDLLWMVLVWLPACMLLGVLLGAWWAHAKLRKPWPEVWTMIGVGSRGLACLFLHKRKIQQMENAQRWPVAVLPGPHLQAEEIPALLLRIPVIRRLVTTTGIVDPAEPGLRVSTWRIPADTWELHRAGWTEHDLTAAIAAAGDRLHVHAAAVPGEATIKLGARPAPSPRERRFRWLAGRPAPVTSWWHVNHDHLADVLKHALDQPLDLVAAWMPHWPEAAVATLIRGGRRSAERLWGTAKDWQDAVGEHAALAYAAGLSLDEARDLAASGQLNPEGLALLVGMAP